MKDSMDSTAAGRAPENTEADGFANRKLIRPSLQRSEGRRDNNGEDRADRRPMPAPKKPSPPEQTHAENFYFQKQMQSKTPMVVVLNDGEELRGVIEWYDKTCIKLNRNNGDSNLMVYKTSIKYMFKDESR